MEELPYQLLFSASPVPIALIRTADQRIEMANPAMLELWERDTSVLNKPYQVSLPQDLVRQFEPHLEQANQRSQRCIQHGCRLRYRSKGSPREAYYNFEYTPLTVSGNQRAILISGTDITAEYRSKLESAAERARCLEGIEDLLNAERDQHQQKNEFIGMVSHELKTPLTSLKAYLQLMGARTAEIGDNHLITLLGKADRQIEKMTQMMSGLLTLARLESGRLHINAERLDLSLLVENFIHEQQLLFPAHQLVYQSSGNAFVQADAEKMAQVLTNLLSNASKFSPHAPLIQLSCQQLDDQVIVQITDRGIGIDPDSLPLIFQPFHRAASGIHRHISGFGIGLYLCSELVRLQDGKIWAESSPGKGTTISFSLPVCV